MVSLSCQPPWSAPMAMAMPPGAGALETPGAATVADGPGAGAASCRGRGGPPWAGADDPAAGAEDPAPAPASVASTIRRHERPDLVRPKVSVDQPWASTHVGSGLVRDEDA